MSLEELKLLYETTSNPILKQLIEDELTDLEMDSYVKEHYKKD